MNKATTTLTRAPKVVMVSTEVASDVAANVKSSVAADWAPAQAPTMTRQVTAEAPAADPISKPYALAMPTIRLGNQSLHEVAPATIAR